MCVYSLQLIPNTHVKSMSNVEQICQLPRFKKVLQAFKCTTGVEEKKVMCINSEIQSEFQGENTTSAIHLKQNELIQIKVLDNANSSQLAHLNSFYFLSQSKIAIWFTAFNSLNYNLPGIISFSNFRSIFFVLTHGMIVERRTDKLS